MDLMSKFTISASMLLTGFAIVFAVLLFLIFLIWFLGKTVTGAQNAVANRATKKLKAEMSEPAPQKAVKAQPAPVTKQKQPPEDENSDEIIAVIAAAVYSMYGSKEKVRIKSIKKASAGGRSAWANAGVMQNTRPF